MNAPQATAAAGEGRPSEAFGAPWQAQIFAMIEMLKNAGVLAPGEWSRALGRRLATLATDDCRDEAIWACWVGALEDLLLERRIAAPLQLAALRQAWIVAAEKTPHGAPIALGRLAYRWAGLDRDSANAASPISPGPA